MPKALSDLAEINPPMALPRGASPSMPVSFVPMSDVTEAGEWIGNQVRALADVRNGFTAFANDDVLVAKITPCFENGKGAHLSGLVNGLGFGSTEFHVLRAREGASPRFIHHLVRGRELRRSAEAHMSGSAGQRRVPRDFFAICEVPDFGLAEQATIAQGLDALDAAVRQTEAIIEKLKQVKQGLLHDLLTRGIGANGELRPPQDRAPHLYRNSPLGWIPTDWHAGPLDAFLDRIIDYRGKTPEKVDAGVTLITARNVRLGYLDPMPREFIRDSAFDMWMTRGLPCRGDILFTMEAPLGNVAQIETVERLAFAQRLVILQAGVEVDSTFLKYLLLGEAFRQRLFALGSGSTVEGIQQSTLRRIPIALPVALSEQRLIAERLSALDERIDMEGLALGKAKALKSGLMDDLLTGRVRVTPLLDPAAV